MAAPEFACRTDLRVKLCVGHDGLERYAPA